tara:strand:- start:39046 stop:39570 length:525 start_codon:yes stop_codon:yes gene_type:complete
MSKQKPSFEEAMNATLLWCNAWEEGGLSDEVLSDRVAELVESQEGARGFFAISLSNNCPLMDRLPDPLIIQLRKAGTIVVDLTVKNLAMSSAMALNHKINKNLKNQEGSERITARCRELLRLLDPNLVKKQLEDLLAAVSGKSQTNYAEFLKRWEYNEDQKLAITKSIYSVATN